MPEADILPDEAEERLTATCRTTVGDQLRSVTYFTRSDFERVYFREDLEQDVDLMGFIGTEWQDFKLTTDTYQASELGDYRYTLRVFENGYLVRIATDSAGVVVTTDGLELRDFDELARAVASTLDEWQSGGQAESSN
ncbi:DUF7522 family protein [Candidatus Halobonum tyrrellensis]|uniref:Uncharacterized protein n=1 Tax=Candidatus Halobonum tyrrellensis G22 TaxID=1324957 RepID=V4GTU6_9EURY|nr:hypothetical protein [Candidatus Halobonum tyrrellensis]ESP88546.1 hypothetical protein K933_08802 [Candidatus Halobonum tyrrellensis G22]